MQRDPLVELLRRWIETDYTPHRTDRPLTPDRDSYTGRAITAKAERLAKLLTDAGYHR